MSSKRTAGTELNHDNWNEEEEAEDAGEFKKASDKILQQRIRKVAKRRIGPGESDGAVSNPFSGFGGFQHGTLKASTPAVSSTASPFSFLSKIPMTTSSTTTSLAANKNGDAKKDIINTEKPATDGKKIDYYSKVKSLNLSFVDWIKSHIDENALYDLRPIFKDYEKHLKELEELKNKSETKASPVVSVESKKESTASTFSFGKPTTNPTFSSSTSTSPLFGSNNNASNINMFSQKLTETVQKDSSPIKSTASATITENKGGFTFGSSSQINNISAAPSFSFGLQKTSTAISTAPLFGSISSTSSTPFSFSNVTQPPKTDTTVTNKDGGNDEDAADEEPPKNEFVPVVEDDSLYSKRCKVFVKTGADYADRGVGTLFLKKVDDKVQLIVRADTNLGNILLNIIVSDGLPTSRLGKNNVMIVCLPLPDSKPPPMPVLLRVKTSDEADDLLKIIEKYKS